MMGCRRRDRDREVRGKGSASGERRRDGPLEVFSPPAQFGSVGDMPFYRLAPV